MANLPPANILLVDDSPANLTALIATLEPLGQNLVTALSGEEALKHLLQQEFAVVLLDVQMPKMNGLEVAQLIRSRQVNEHIPIIFLTAIDRDFAYIRQGYAVGAVDYLLKPIVPEIILSKVSVFVELFQKTAMIKQQAEQLAATNINLQTEIKERQLALQTLQQAQIKLQKSEAALAAAQRIAHVGSWELDIVTKRFTWSEELLQIFGLDIDELAPTYTEFFNYIHPDDCIALQTQFTQAIAQHTPFQAEYRIVLPDNSVRYLEFRAEIADKTEDQVSLNQPGQENNCKFGAPQRIWGIVIDITKQKLIEQSLRRYERMVSTTKDGMVLIDRHYIYQVVNQAYLDWRQKSREEIIGHSVSEILGQEVFEEVVKHRFIECLGGQTIKYERWWEDPGQEPKFLSFTYSPYIEFDQTISGVVVSVRDMTEFKRTEEALHKSEVQFQVFMNNSPVLAWITDSQGKVIFLSQKYLQTFKLFVAPAIGRSLFEIYPAHIAQQFLDNIQKVARTNQVIETIEFAPRLDDTLGEFLVYKFPIPSTSPQKLIGGVAIDITERKILERELAQKQQLLDAFISSAPVGITVLDQELRFSLINEAFADINGVPADEHIGKTIREIVPDLASQQEQVLHHVLTTGEAILDFEITGETLKLPGVMRTWLASYFPICSETTQPSGVGIVIVEITERQRAEQMLELQAVITRNMAEGVCLVRAADSIIVYTNPKFDQMFGYDTGELIGQNVSIVNYVDETTKTEAVAQAIISVVLENDAVTYEVHNIKKDGTAFWCRANTSVFLHPEYGTVLVAVQQDITEQKQAQEKIAASLKEKEVLLQEIHHRVKNNLGIVSSLLQMQCRRTQDPQSTAILQDSQNRIASIALVHEKLYRSQDLAKINFAQYIPDLTTHLFDSYNVSSQQIKLHLQVENVNLDIETAIPLGLIINELVSNALKYAFPEKQQGEIMVKLYQKNEQNLTLIVKDNGVGLPPDFEMKKTKTLGISLVQGLVKQLRGSLKINSHKGTEFEMNLTK
ncbi:PAS domain S-box protein [Nostoc sp. TCL26-01]|uniref:PAS domain S-box protein n=1 Tax=Nostoc sp. TCL26-01 TaxID=2576904 RepID=UPI0015BFC5BD|nr:PAS domain S-box protein [Nostoc sp. TCL26-01]QLE58332.1 PAS domain S-box protein [Nostoc sp. TCL26-01]